MSRQISYHGIICQAWRLKQKDVFFMAEINMDSPVSKAIRNRIDSLRRIYHGLPVFTDGLSRPNNSRVLRQKLNYMRSYVDNPHRAYTVRLRKAYADADVMLQMKPVIYEHELIVGLPDYSPLTPEEQAEYDELEKKMQSAPETCSLTRGHMALDYEKLVRVGVNGLISEIGRYKNALDMNDPDSLSKDEFYEGCLADLNALNDLGRRYSAYAANLAAEEEDPVRARELRVIADNFKVIPMNPPQTFYQGLQLVHFYTFVLNELYFYGRVDRYLFPLYEADIKSGRLTYEKAVELYACFMMMAEAYIEPGVAKDAMVGGRDRQGNPVENELTYVCLDAIRFSHTANCKVSLAVGRYTSRELLLKGLHIISEGNAQPAMFNDDLVVASLIRHGVAEADAYDYCNTGCVEPTPCGTSGCYVVAPYHNLIDYLLDVMRTSPEHETEEAFMTRIEERIQKAIFDENLTINRRQMERSRIGADQMMESCLVHDCLETGKAVDEGGARYNFTEPNFIGFGSFIDSIRALREMVFSGEYTMKEFLRILDSDFADNEALRQRIRNKVPHFGTNDASTDEIAAELGRMLVRCCAKVVNYRGRAPLLPGVFSFVMHDVYGKVTCATPDGRHSGYPLSSGSSPVQGCETNGPTAALLSNTSWDQSDFLGGVAINMKFSPGQMTGENEEAMLDFVRVFLERSGFQLQINCVSTETLKKAQKEPEKYADLVVRVGGFSAYFTRLSSGIQQEIIDRNEHII